VEIKLQLKRCPVPSTIGVFPTSDQLLLDGPNAIPFHHPNESQLLPAVLACESLDIDELLIRAVNA